MTSDVVVVPEGTYYIVSNYGDANSVVRSDIRVQAGKLTDITVTHRAAAITLKLVTDQGGEALANTAWSVLTPGGDVVKYRLAHFHASFWPRANIARSRAMKERSTSANLRLLPAWTAMSRCGRAGTARSIELSCTGRNYNCADDC